jgi:carbamoyl-phosphate synthase large subunit
VFATPGTARVLEAVGVEVEMVPKVGRGSEDVQDTVQRLESGDVDLVINTVGSDPVAVRDSASLRRTALLRSVPYTTTIAGARATVGAIRALQRESIGVRTLQEIHGK